jgi:hypothetical protein
MSEVGSIITMIKSRRMRWAWHVARMGENKNAYRILVGKSEWKRPTRNKRQAAFCKCLDDGLNIYLRPRHSSSDWSLASHYGGPGSIPGLVKWDLWLTKWCWGRFFSEYFGFPCQSSFHQLLHNHPQLSSGVGAVGQKWPQYKGLSPTPLAIKKYTFETSMNFAEFHADIAPLLWCSHILE